MNKMIFEVRSKNGSLVHSRIGATNHGEESHLGLAEFAVGAILFLVTTGIILFLVTV